MTEKELSEMTVMQLRKLAKENSITLGAGIDKAGIIRKILDNSKEENTSFEPVLTEEIPQIENEPRFQAAWHNSDAPIFNARPAYQAPGTASRPAWQNTSPSGHQLPVQQRVQPVRPGSYTPRFGPAASGSAASEDQRNPYTSEITGAECRNTGCVLSECDAGSDPDQRSVAYRAVLREFRIRHRHCI